MTTIYAIWLVVILALVFVAFLFLRGALSVEAKADNGDDCICKKTRFAVWADMDCPVHGEHNHD